MKLLDDFFDIQRKIYKNFNYEEEWHLFPLDDLTDRFWTINSHTLWFADTKDEIRKILKSNFAPSVSNQLYSNIILNDCVLPSNDQKWTMVKCDTKNDNNLVLAILDNTKKL